MENLPKTMETHGNRRNTDGTPTENYGRQWKPIETEGTPMENRRRTDGNHTENHGQQMEHILKTGGKRMVNT